MAGYYAKFVLRNGYLMNNFHMQTLKRFLLLWLSTTLALWIVDGLFDGLVFHTSESLLLSGLVLALANLTLKPLLVLITLPLTLLSFGLALPIINGVVLLGVAKLVPGFAIAGFWTGVVCALAVSLVSALIGMATGQSRLRGQVHVGRFRGDVSGSWGGRDQDRPSDPNVIDGEVREKPTSGGSNKPPDPDRLEQK